MSSPIEQVAARCTQAFNTGSLLLRGSPAAAGWVLGWLNAEFAPQVLTGHALATVSPLQRVACALAVQKADKVLDAALEETFGKDYTSQVRHPLDEEPGHRPNVAAVLDAMHHRRRYAATTRNISYGPRGRNNTLDIWRRPDLPEGYRAPVLIQVPGGAWSVNDKHGQAYPLMARMSELGWICVTINYSRSPRNAFPSHIIDVKRAIAWVKANIAEYGGDPDFVAITGGSAGGHLSSLAALSAGDETLQPGFESADTSVQAVAPYYGVYDLTTTDKMHPLMMPLLEHVVVQRRLEDNPQIYRDASPLHRIHRDAPPFFVLHGESDAVIPSAQARDFVAALRYSGPATVAYAELPKAHHAFDTIATLRCQLAAEAVASFMGIVYGRHVAARNGTQRVAVGSAS